MANQTVYPYGQGGQLPSGYPIADDLNTDSAQQVLSARQGKILGDRVINKVLTVLSSSLTEQNYSIKGDATTPSWQAGKHYAFPVTPGETIKLYITSSTTDGAYVGFVSEAYDEVAPTSAGKFPRAPGASVFWAYKASSYSLVVPEYAKYLIVTKQSASYSAESKLERALPSPLFTDFFGKDKGDELYDGIIGVYEEIDTSELTVSPCYLGETKWTDTGSHIVVPVTAGQKIKLRTIYSSSDGGFYAFLRSSYVAPSAAGGTIPYVSGYERTWITYPGTDTSGIEVTVPDGAAYLCLCLLVQSYKTAIWDVARLNGGEMMSNYIKTSQIVNNTFDGGTDVPLSAEQGKKLASMIVDGIPSGLQKYSYNGAAVKLNYQHYVSKEKVSQITSISCQGGACFGNYLFMFSDNVATCWMYNLSTQSLIQTISVASEQRGFVSNAHCNTVNFGNEYYDGNDTFPLLYVSTGYSSDGYSGALVYRIVATVENDTTTYSLVLVQTIKMPSSLGWTEFIIGEEGDCYIKSESEGVKYYRMILPTLSQGDIALDFNNALAVYHFPPQPSWYNGSRNQGHIYHNGKIYLVSGVPTSEASLFIVLDLATCRREVEIDLYNTLGLTSEPETVFVWNGHICIAFRSNTDIYALYFE